MMIMEKWVRAMTELPVDGELQLGQIRLPAGKRFHAGFGPARRPVAWVTREEVPEAGGIWAALYDGRQETGLIPFLAGHLGGEPARPWDSEEFYEEPADPGGLGRRLDRLRASAVLKEWWNDQTSDFEAELAAEVKPFLRKFPGLAPAGSTALTAAQLTDVLNALPPHRIGLVPATEPAEALPLVGWCPAGLPEHTLEVAAVVRSWEDRFGVRLLKIGFAEFSVLATRPPRSLPHAQQLAAEQWAFCDEVGYGLSDIGRISAYILISPIWSFWWD